VGAKQATAAFEVASRAGVEYRSHKYEHDPSHQSFGIEAAEKLAVDPARVFKTLVVSTGDNLAVGIVPVQHHLDLKAMASALSVKSASMADMALAEKVTGYIAGGISPLGQKKRLATVLDQSAFDFATIFVSGGRRGLEIELAPADLMNLTNAICALIAR
jgi:Cys-tRNA(Pro)/Cys-tRNA(Cys) deacylase